MYADTTADNHLLPPVVFPGPLQRRLDLPPLQSRFDLPNSLPDDEELPPVDDSAPEHGEEPSVHDAEPYIRDNALFIESKALAKMDTDSVLDLIRSTLEASPSAPTGLEWVNDTSVVLLYSTPDDASASFFFITGEGLDSTALLVAKPFIIETSTELPFTVRAALSTDIRARDSAAKSEYYKSRPLWSSGRPSRREREEEPKPYEQKGRRKRGGKGRRNRDGDDDSRKTRTAGDLDAELDAYIRNG